MSLAEIKTAVDELSPEELLELASFVRARENAAELEARENPEDLATAKAALANPGEIISLDELEKRLGL